jgi:hypothetical protein
LIAGTPGALLLVPEKVSQAGPVVALFDASDGARRALEAGIRFAVASQTGLVLLIAAATGDANRALQHQATQIVGARVLGVRMRRIDVSAAPADLARLLRSEGESVLILPGDSVFAQEGQLRLLLELIRNPVLLIR